MYPLRKAILLSLRLYKRFVSPLLPPACRFWPTCSEYAYQAISQYGIWHGGWIAVKRLSKCHPLHSGGVDSLR